MCLDRDRHKGIQYNKERRDKMIREFFDKIFRKEAAHKVRMMLHFPSGHRLRYRYVQEDLRDGEHIAVSKLNKKIESLRKRFDKQGWTEQSIHRCFKWVSPEDPKFFFCLWAD